MDNIAAFVSNPFMPIDREQVADQFHHVFALPRVDMEMVYLQKDS